VNPKAVFVVVSNDPNIQGLQQNLPAAGSEYLVQIFEVAQTALETLSTQENIRLLVLDWDFLTAKGISKFLQSFEKIRRAQPIPFMIVVSEPTPGTIAMAMEYEAVQLLMRANFNKQVGNVLTEFLSKETQRDVFQSLIDDLEVSLKSKNSKAIDEAVETLMKQFPHNPRAQVEFGNNLIRKSQYSEAERVARDILEKVNDNVRAISLLARAKMHQRKFDEAIDLMQRCDTLSPDRVDRLVLFGDIYWNKGQNESAREKYGRALELDGDNLDAKKGLATVAVSVGKEAEAFSLLGNSLSRDEVAAFFNNAGILSSRSGRFDEAVRLYQCATKELDHPELKAKVLYNMGLAYERSGHSTEAQRAFAEAKQLAPELKKIAARMGNNDTISSELFPKKQA
jgi:tetratricopeptide (TPR) repeat protein